MYRQILRFALLTVVLALLAACNREPQPLMSPVGLWQGTFITTSGGSGTQTFTAEINDVAQSEGFYEGVFTVNDRAYDVSGSFTGRYKEGERFEFYAPLPELQPATSPTLPAPGLHWSGMLTTNSYQGEWLNFGKERGYPPLQTGAFKLERFP